MDWRRFVVPLLCASQLWPPSAVCRMVPSGSYRPARSPRGPSNTRRSGLGRRLLRSVASSVEGGRDETRYKIKATTRIPIAAAATFAQIGALERNPKSDARAFPAPSWAIGCCSVAPAASLRSCSSLLCSPRLRSSSSRACSPLAAPAPACSARRVCVPSLEALPARQACRSSSSRSRPAVAAIMSSGEPLVMSTPAAA